MAVGILVWDDRKYYIVSMLIIILSMLPFFHGVRGRRPRRGSLWCSPS
jgi:hypothetical protein